MSEARLTLFGPHLFICAATREPILSLAALFGLDNASYNRLYLLVIVYLVDMEARQFTSAYRAPQAIENPDISTRCGCKSLILLESNPRGGLLPNKVFLPTN